MRFSIREAGPGDYEALCAVLEEGDAYHRRALPHVFRPPAGPARSVEYMLGIMADENAVFYVAERQGQIVGAIHVLIRETRQIPILVPRRYAVVDTLVVAKAHRRRGVGRALMEAGQRWAADRKASQIELNVWEFNEGALAFYEELGYRTASRHMWKAL